MSAPIKLYHDNLSQPSRALYLFLKINNIPLRSGNNVNIPKLNIYCLIFK